MKEKKSRTWCLWLIVGKYSFCDAFIVVIFYFNDFHTLVFIIVKTIADKQTLITADNKGSRWVVAVNVFPVMTSRAAKDAGQKLENAIDGILLILVPLAGCQSFLPEVLVGALELVKICRYGLLMTLDSSDTTDYGVDVQDLGTTTLT